MHTQACVHLRTLESLSPQLAENILGALLFIARTVREGAFVTSDPKTQGTADTRTGLMDIST